MSEFDSPDVNQTGVQTAYQQAPVVPVPPPMPDQVAFAPVQAPPAPPVAYYAATNPPETVKAYPFKLRQDEVVMAEYPITHLKRGLGKIVSYVFVTDSRLVYAAETKTPISSSSHIREYAIRKIEGVETTRSRGLNTTALIIAVGLILNLVMVLTMSSYLYEFVEDHFYSLGLNGLVGTITTIMVLMTLLVGGVGVYLVTRPSAVLRVSGPSKAEPLVWKQDWFRGLVSAILVFILILVAGPLVLILWFLGRMLGFWVATEAPLYTVPEYVDRLAYEIGAAVLDGQARGRLVNSGT